MGFGTPPPSKPTREIFLPCVRGSDQFETGEFLIDADGEYASMLIDVPHDFNSITSLTVIWIGMGVDDFTFQYTGFFAATGETPAMPTEGSKTITEGTAGKYYETDVSDIFAGVEAGDHIILEVKRETGGDMVLAVRGVRLKYV